MALKLGNRSTAPPPPQAPPSTAPPDRDRDHSPVVTDDDRSTPSPDLETPSLAQPTPSLPTLTSTAARVDEQEADRIAREAVRRELDRQADKARYDVSDGNRVVIVLDDESLRTYTEQWSTYNSTANSKLNFTQYLADRLRACRTHTSTRPIYIADTVRQTLEDLFNEVITSELDLQNKIDRHIRPIIESPDLPDGVLRFKPLDPGFMEMVAGWEPDKPLADAVSDFVLESAYQRAGIW